MKRDKNSVINKNKQSVLVGLGICVAGCSTPPPQPKVYPALEYAAQIKRDMSGKSFRSPANITPVGSGDSPRARISYADLSAPAGTEGAQNAEGDVVTNMPQLSAPLTVEESSAPLTRDYNGPLSLGDPGVQSSLWRESRRGTYLFQDHRAWQPMDLVTIVVSEKSQGSKDADTSVKTESSISATFEQFLGIPQYLFKKIDTYLTKDANGNVDTSQSMVKGGSSSEYKGEGETTRKGALTAKISAMVAEVLPSGILRIEGKKIISVNNEDEVMVISGLIRTTDINSNNEVDSSKVANVRIDYYGSGTVGDAQHGGWLGNAVRKFWPF